MTTLSMPWSEWEDYLQGMYRSAWTPESVDASRSLLTDPDQFYEVAREMLRHWPHAAQQNLRHMWSGRNAWLGQASCLYCHAAPAGATREAWGRMTNAEQTSANLIARQVRTEWEGGDRAETLFGA